MPDSRALPPPAQLLQLLTGMAATQMIATAAKLGLADRLKAGPQSAAEVAEAASANPDATYRLMRGLAAIGVLEEQAERRFALTPVGACLCVDHPASMSDFAQFIGSDWHWAIWSELTYSIQTGNTAFTKVHGSSPFEWLTAHPAALKLFNDAMTSLARPYVPAVLDAYDFSAARRVADVGGGHGSMLTGILERHPNTTGVLFDMPEVTSQAKGLILESALAGRCEVIGGSFFESAPSGCDIYLLKQVLHNWDDECARNILRHIAREMTQGAKLLVIEQVIPPAGVPHLTQLLDLEMLVLMAGGRERTADEYDALFRSVGLRLSRVVPTRSPVSIVEALAA
jgi:hypothetical protein